jgi:hypothetical protein
MPYEKIEESLGASDIENLYNDVKNMIPVENLYESPEMDFTDHYMDPKTPRTPDTKIVTKALHCFDSSDLKLFSLGINYSSKLGKGMLSYHEGDPAEEGGYISLETNSDNSAPFIMDRVKKLLSKIK